jgi:molybdate transport system regulatory protein
VPQSGPKKTALLSHHPQPGYAVNGRVWVEKDGELYMGWGRAILLERIDQLGSITAAAKSMKLGYRNAWLWVESLNRLAPAPLVEKATGGVGGGYTRVTEEGRKAVREYKALRARFQEFLKQAH